MNQPKNTVVIHNDFRVAERPLIVLIDGKEHTDWVITLAGSVLIQNVHEWGVKAEAVYADGTRLTFGGNA